MTKSIYDEHYQKPDYFGSPYPGLIDFFQRYEPKGTVLDLGCGQGRDALFLGRMGYQVTGIDISDVGIQQFNQAAQKEKLQLKGIVADINSYRVTEDYDIVLLDSMLHFYKNDLEKETELVKRILNDLKVGGIIANFMLKGNKREKQLKSALHGSGISFDILLEGYTDYPEHQSEFHMYIIQKRSGMIRSGHDNI